MVRRQVPDAPDNSAQLSLFELRQEMVRRAGTLSARARGLRDRGATRSAARVAAESDRLVLVAKTMAEKAQRRRSS